RAGASPLAYVPGVGPPRKTALHPGCGPPARLPGAREDEIRATPGIGPEVARGVFERLHGVREERRASA
ncbi:MAG: hypothetical protein ACT4PO_11980, partial [Actinomycetota bacterium]